MAVSKLKIEHAILLVNSLQFIYQHSGKTQEADVPSASLPSHPDPYHHAHTAPKPQSSPWKGHVLPAARPGSWQSWDAQGKLSHVYQGIGMGNHRIIMAGKDHQDHRPIPTMPMFLSVTSPVPVTPPPPGQPGCQCPTTLSEKKLFHPT